MSYNSGLNEVMVNQYLAQGQCDSICQFDAAHEDKHDLWVITEAIEGAKPIFGALNQLKALLWVEKEYTK